MLESEPTSTFFFVLGMVQYDYSETFNKGYKFSVITFLTLKPNLGKEAILKWPTVLAVWLGNSLAVDLPIVVPGTINIFQISYSD